MNPERAKLREGTRQVDRMLPALDCNYVSVEERAAKQLVQFASQYAKYLWFFNEKDERVGNWAKMFEAGIDDILLYMENPELFAVDPNAPAEDKKLQKEKLEFLSKPHLAMFLSFLKLLNYPLAKFKELTRRHIDFYYKDVLRFEKKRAEPDRVHVYFEPSLTIDRYSVEKGTFLNAGTDSLGNDLYYELSENVTIGHAEIGSVKTLRMTKKYSSLNDMREMYEDGLEVVLKWALGQYFQGDELPSYPNGKYWDTPVTLDWLLTKYQDIRIEIMPQDELTIFKNYVLEQLCFVEFDHFIYCIELQRKADDPTEEYPTGAQWRQGCDYIEDAYYKRFRRDRIGTLMGERESNGLEGLFRMALGLPRPGDSLPPMPGSEDTFESIYNVLLKEVFDDDYFLAARYVTRDLGLSVIDFKRIMDIKAKADIGEAGHEEWKEVCTLLHQAEKIIRGSSLPLSGRWDVRSVLPETITDSSEIVRFPALGRDGIDRFQVPDPSLFYGPGFAIVSPLLRLSGGSRTIKLEIACKEKDFPLADLKRLNSDGDLIFDIHLSGESEWLELNTLQDSEFVDVEVDMIGEELVSRYSPAELLVITSIKSTGTPISGEHILFNDGSVWMVVEPKGSGRFSLQYVTRFAGTWDSRRLRTLEPAGDGDELENMEISVRGEIIEIGATSEEAQAAYGGSGSGEYFFDYDLGSFIIWKDGGIFQIDQIIAPDRTQVSYLGTIPEYESFFPKKYSQINFKNSLDVTKIEPLGVTVGETAPFDEDDLGRLLIFDSGLTLKIRYLIEQEKEEEEKEEDQKDEENKTFLEAVIDILDQKTPAPLSLETKKTMIEKYSSYPGFRFTIDLDKEMPAVAAPGEALSLPGITAPYPVMKVALANRLISDESGVASVDMPYEFFQDIRLHKALVSVNVSGVNNVIAGNDSGSLDPNAPFEPFTSTPIVGSTFYFTSLELSEKKLKTLELRIEWSDLPENFEDYYKPYIRSGVPGIPKINNETFKAKLSILNNGAWMEVEEAKLLFRIDTSGVCRMSFKDGFNRSSYKTLTKTENPTLTDPTDFIRYFKLELQDPDFQHSVYSYVLTQLGYSDDERLRSMLVYEPYSPTVKRFAVDYTSTTSIQPSYDDMDDPDLIFHIHPFGYINAAVTLMNTDSSKGAFLLPRSVDEGALFIGLSGAEPPQMFNILFQLVPGSGQSGLTRPVLRWSYLTEYGWKNFDGADILEESTGGFINSGIVRLRLPYDASNLGPLMPEGLHWIKISAMKSAAAASDIVDIRLNAGLAVFKDNNNAPDHLGSPLPANSITATAENFSEISAVYQPFSSFGGRMQEEDSTFYTRVSERLRHKGRALTPWDYERLVLEKFPDLCHIKCICYGEHYRGQEDPGQISLVVIPDITNVSPFLPLEPKVAPQTLRNIEEYLKEIASPFVNIRAKNPYYEQVMLRVAVRFHPGYGEGYYSQKLNEDIKKFLSPWAYDRGAEITFGGKINVSNVIHFMEKLYYVDYVAMVKLFLETVVFEGTDDEELKFKLIENGVTTTNRPDSILVSAEKHIVDVISTTTFVEDDFIGIGYMIIELDFLLKGTEEGGETVLSEGIMPPIDPNKVFSGVGFLIVGLDFIPK